MAREVHFVEDNQTLLSCLQKVEMGFSIKIGKHTFYYSWTEIIIAILTIASAILIIASVIYKYVGDDEDSDVSGSSHAIPLE
ncbi:MAG: hypothetical protein BM555_05545 [Crocinitomix sp. MedPE-SWsnd]|nr:MAG: hypothetical protein BM555_05545 [Crocinitomix sp. MedPE-SWsnd]